MLSIEEFEAFLKKDNAVNHAELKEAFDLFDVNKNGYISKDELIQAMKNVGENLSDKDIDTMIKNADVNQDGQVSFEGKRLSSKFQSYSRYTAVMQPVKVRASMIFHHKFLFYLRYKYFLVSYLYGSFVHETLIVSNEI